MRRVVHLSFSIFYFFWKFFPGLVQILVWYISWFGTVFKNVPNQDLYQTRIGTKPGFVPNQDQPSQQDLRLIYSCRTRWRFFISENQIFVQFCDRRSQFSIVNVGATPRRKRLLLVSFLFFNKFNSQSKIQTLNIIKNPELLFY